MRYILFFILLSVPAQAVPVIPGFNSGSTTSRTESKQNTTELIESWSYSTGYEYSVGGTNLNIQGDLLPNTVTTGSHTVDGVTTTHHGIDLNSKPTVTMQTQGAATNLIEQT